MVAKVAVKVGNASYEFSIDEGKEMEILNKIITLGNPPRYCNVCKNNTYFALDTNKDKEGNIYVNVKCLGKGCFAKAKLGQYKTGGFFWHSFEKYVKDSEVNKEAKDIADEADEAIS